MKAAWTIMRSSQSTPILLLIILVTIIPVFTIAGTFSSAINNGQGGIFKLDGSSQLNGGVYISGNTTIDGNGSTIQLGIGESIQVSAGTELEIFNVTIIGGDGILISGAANNPGKLTADDITVAYSSSSAILCSNGIVSLSNSLFSNSDYGVHLIEGSIAERINGCTFSHIDRTGLIFFKSQGWDVSGNNFNNIKENAVYVESCDLLNISNSVFENNYNDGSAHCISIQNSANVTIDNGTVFRDSDRSILAKNSTDLKIKDTTIKNCPNLSGITLVDGTSAIIDSCDISGGHSGLGITNQSNVTVLNSYIHHNLMVNPGDTVNPVLGQGIFIIEGGICTIKNSLITDNNNEGVYCLNSQHLTVESSTITNNGWVANDGSGIYSHNTTALIKNNEIGGNFLKGILIEGNHARIEGNEIRNNRTGGIYVVSNSPDDLQEIYRNIVKDNVDGSGFESHGIDVAGAATTASVENNVITGSWHAGLLVETGSSATARGNIIYNNHEYNVNIYYSNIIAEGNVIFDSLRNVFHNESYDSRGNFNDIFSAQDFQAYAICNSCNLDYTNNWWGYSSASIGRGIQTNPKLSSPVSQYALFPSFSFQDELTLSSQSLPYMDISLLSTTLLIDQSVTVQVSKVNLFPRLPVNSQLPADTLYAWIGTSANIQKADLRATLKFKQDIGIINNTQNVYIYKFDEIENTWVSLTGEYFQADGIKTFETNNLDGYYLISTTGPIPELEREINPDDIMQLTPYGDIWGSENIDGTILESPTRWAWLGFRYDPNLEWATIAGDFLGGDGLLDLACVTEFRQLWVAKNTGDKTFVIDSPPANGFNIDMTKSHYIFTGDFDGNGLDDVLQLVGDVGHAWVGLSTGSEIQEPTKLAGGPGFTHDPYMGWWVGVGDMTGDDIDDIVQVTPFGDVWVAVTENLTLTSSRWGWPGFKQDIVNEWSLRIGDFNGDNRDDLACLTSFREVWVALSNGTSFEPPVKWASGYLRDAPDLGWNVFVGDMNGDGKDDMVQKTDTSEFMYVLSNGHSFEQPKFIDHLMFQHYPDGPDQILIGNFY